MPGLIGAVITSPLEVVKTRMQSAQYRTWSYADVKLLSRRFNATVKGLVGGLRATAVAVGSVGYRGRALDLLTRLGPLEFII